jgi:nitrous oxide reductase accessory protein NosL
VSRHPLIALLAIALAATACERADPLAPPTVHFGEDICHVCGMIVTDERFAAAAIRRADDRLVPCVFDDVGCLVRFEAKEAAPALYVRDYASDAWIAFEDAVYAHCPTLPTPMASGVAAFATRDAAAVVTNEHPGELIDAATLRARLGPDAATTRESAP